ncbi:polyphosphate kinase 1 [uncultured Desulfobulbus sp.]|uniref:polyphosphate kinase 1 n=1 Tax=uncultured Desulfobulbus sp. TaxID=239745 RepID=UPI0029C92101|nr:polyphosphate kinase 1 [uncultured Desulfobulbus sp.]
MEPSQTSRTAPQASPPPFDLESPQWYLNRELTWLAFNRRVLHEGQDDRVPLLERVFFLAVVGSNLDEFFMKRIGGLKQQVGAGVKELSIDGRLPQEQIDDCTLVVRDLLREQEELEVELKRLLARRKIRIVPYADLDLAEKSLAERYFLDQVYPLLTPQGMDPAHPFPFISNLSINLLVSVRYPDSEHSYMNRIKAPVSDDMPRFLRFGDSGHWITLEDLIGNNLETLFPEMVVETCETFRVTRNAITEPNQEQANDLLQVIESALRERKFAEIVRLEVGWGMEEHHRGMLADELGVNEECDVFAVDGIVGKRDLFEIARLDRPELHYLPHKPLDNPELLDENPNIFHVIRKHGSILLQHPYESFDTSVERYLREASVDPKVRAIKMTLYRTAGKSRVIEYLIDAARNGKQVAVVLELKARFDEQANIRWAGFLEEAGIHVTYGVVGLKTHCKVIFVIRKDYDGLRRYAHIGTGNYHAGTARMYCDLGLFTCDPDIGADLTELFNYLTTGYTPMRRYRKLLPSPRLLKKALLQKIDREIRGHSAEEPGLIQLKANGLEDREIVAALYRASQAGVHVDLIIRDTCRLRPGIAGLSDNICVVSLVGRFLEHTRLFYFRNRGEEEYFIGSADLMQRNLESRVEVCVPVESPKLRKQLRQLLDLQLKNKRNVWEMEADGTYRQRFAKARDGSVCIHRQLIERAEKRQASGHRSAGKKKGRKKVG